MKELALNITLLVPEGVEGRVRLYDDNFGWVAMLFEDQVQTTDIIA